MDGPVEWMDRHRDLLRLVITLWSIWYARRKAIYEDIFHSPLSTHSFKERFLVDLEGARPQIERRGAVQASASHWIPPPQGMMKVK